jgi:O-antigen/teichoic acid export membrane protein
VGFVVPAIAIKKVIGACCPSGLKPFLARIETSEIGYRLAKGAFWSMAGAVISRGLMFAASVLVARMLGKTGFGEFGMIQSTVGMFGILAGFGLGLTATKHIAEFLHKNPERAGNILGLSSLTAGATGFGMTLLLFGLAPWMSTTLNAPHLTPLLRIGSLMLAMSAVSGGQTGALAGFEAFKDIALINLFVGLASFPILFCGTYFWGLTLNCLINYMFLKKTMRIHHIRVSLSGARSELRVLWHFSLPAVLSSACVGPAVWACNAIVVNQWNGYAALGIYSSALMISVVIGSINDILGQTLLPICSSQTEARSARFEFVNNMMPWAIGLFLALPCICLPELWAMFFGSDYSSRSMLRSIALVGFVSVVIAHRQGIARNFVTGGYLWWSLLGNLFWGVSAIMLTYVLRDLGAEGRALSFAVAYLLNTLVFIPFYVRKRLCSKCGRLSLSLQLRSFC